MVSCRMDGLGMVDKSRGKYATYIDLISEWLNSLFQLV